MLIKKVENSDDISQAVKDNDGYCPCKLIRNADTKCPCKEFIENPNLGMCECGLFTKVEK